MKYTFWIWLCSINLLAAQTPTPLVIGTEIPVQHHTGTPYNPNDQNTVVFQQTFFNKNSAYIKLYFEEFDLAAGDYVEISTTHTGASIIYAGKGKIINKDGTMISDFWSQALMDEEVTVRLHSKGKSSHRGFLISRVAYGFSEAELETLAAKDICGINDMENIWCYNGTDKHTAGQAVCKLIIGGSRSCTGWLLGSEGHVMTNNHCIANTTEANNTDFIFDYEKRVCSGLSLRQGDLVASSSSLVSTNTVLDYTLLSLPTNPTLDYGFLQLNPDGPQVGDPIYIVGHPNGQRKRISLNSDMEAGNIARVSNITSNRVEYFADTKPGSSGSPVLSQTDNSVLALHSQGGCPNKSKATSTQLITDIGSAMPPAGLANIITNLPYRESFENITVSSTDWQNVSQDDFDWNKTTGSTPSSNTGPSAAADGSIYYHIEASGNNHPNKVALLYSPKFRLNSPSSVNATFSFNYHMFGAEMGNLRLQVSTNAGQNWTTLWEKSGDQGNQWLNTTLDVSSYINVADVQFRFRGRTGNGFHGDMAVDNIIINTFIPPTCQTFYPATSNFDISLGGWNQNSNDDFDWTRRSGSTPSSNTGPSAAHSGSHYIYTEATSNINQLAIITSNCYDLSILDHPQITFFYHMNGSHMGTLSLEISTDNGNNWTSLWTRSGDQGTGWKVGSVKTGSQSSSALFRFVGQVGSSYTSDMAIDGFSVDERVFIELNPAVSTATTTPALSSLEEAPYLVVAPNPFDQHIQVQTNLQGAVYYRVVNLQGQVVQEGLLQEPNLSLSSLHTGLYFLTIYNEQEQLTHKIVHQ